ncbi:alkaline phosphatase PafA [Zunongwangia sp. HGR-M22]|uniref:alkaline phosphatase PafA n=1 Tax=Zunongwangia sp. HGR-M22 TaxID=3015168 RepID=UPI0022DE93CA|nr:alkaline phosphatase PafA [Zunongwangia sp. HGR-M22]WBL26151.1 alkaline phosphatase family protein [Zunongwangia sp. HGR-M22]
MKRIYLATFMLLFAFSTKAQQSEIKNKKPKLVVGIVVDQMRYDYLNKFWNKYDEGGFKRLIKEGFNFRNNHFNYAPTYTGPGHTSVWTGTSPMNHGIIGNNWYDKFAGEMVYCAQDDDVESVGTKTDAGKMSPHRVEATTLSDQNRLHTQFRGKTIGVSIKDRGSILPAGHTANAAYWYSGGDDGKFITSTYYMEELPAWVKDFNKSGKSDSYLKEWNTLYDIETYTESGEDDNDFENGFKGKDKATFPYNLKKLSKKNGNYSLIPQTPYGDDITLDFALAAIKGEDLGKDEDTDILTLSFSSTDKVGHNFGANSKEVEDTYLRLDKNLSDLLSYLDENVGKGEYTIFLTADHGGGHVGGFLDQNRIPTGDLDYDKLKDDFSAFSTEKFGDGLIKNVSNNQIFFDYEYMADNDLNPAEVESKIEHFLIQQPGVYKVYTRNELQANNFSNGLGYVVQNGFNQKRSGDVIIVTHPGSGYGKGSTHGSVFNYDTHTPLLFFGAGVPKGETYERSEIVDIAPTMAAILGIEYPNATSGKPLAIMLDKASE